LLLLLVRDWINKGGMGRRAHTMAARPRRAGDAASVNRHGHTARQIGKALIQDSRARQTADEPAANAALTVGPAAGQAHGRRWPRASGRADSAAVP